MAAIPTKEFKILLKIVSSLKAITSMILTPSGFSTASHFSIACLKTGMCSKVAP